MGIREACSSEAGTRSPCPYPLPDALWQRLEPLFEPQARGAPPRYARRSLVEAIFLVLREGRPWKSLPSSYPPGKMVYWHYQNWVSQGVWAEVEALVSAGELDSSPGAC